MTLPLFLAAHLVYGMGMGMLILPRLKAEGEVIGVPLLLSLTPVAAITAPLGTILLRYAGGWFLHGALHGQGSIAYERFHLGLMLLVAAGAVGATLAGLFGYIAAITRDRLKLSRAPLFVAGF